MSSNLTAPTTLQGPGPGNWNADGLLPVQAVSRPGNPGSTRRRSERLPSAARYLKRSAGVIDLPQPHRHSEAVKNITLSVADAVYHAARVEAAKRNTNVGAVVRACLRAFARGQAPILPGPEGDHERRNRERLVKLPRDCKLELGCKPSRAKTQEGGRFSRFVLCNQNRLQGPKSRA